MFSPYMELFNQKGHQRSRSYQGQNMTKKQQHQFPGTRVLRKPNPIHDCKYRYQLNRVITNYIRARADSVIRLVNQLATY